MPRDAKNKTAGFTALSGGMQSGIDAAEINDNQVSYGVNSVTRKGFRWTRPLFRQQTLNWQGDSDASDWFNSHAITGWSYYTPANGEQMLVCCSGGRFFSFRPAGAQWNVFEITPSSERFASTHAQVWFCQAAQYLVAQDGVHAPFIFDGAVSRYSDTANNEVPTGKQMAYVNYRLFVVLPDGRQVAPGDLAYASVKSVLQFTEILLSAADGGQPLSIPLENGAINALIPTAQLDTQTGQGVLLAATTNSICSFNPIVQRSQWPNITLQNIALVSNGFTSQNCAIVNGDVWGRAVDGWRSFRMARYEFQSWGNTPQSYEIQRILDQDSPNLLDHASFVYFDNRLIGTCSPVVYSPGIYHRGVVALDFVNVASLAGKSPPCYDGLWTGIQPYGLVTGRFSGQERCFAFCFQSQTENALWEITTEYGDDNDSTKIPCLIETKAYDFQTPGIWKILQDLELWIDSVRGDVIFDIKYRPDQWPCWFDWITFKVEAKDKECNESPLDPTQCQTPVSFEDQYRPRLWIGQPPNQTTPILETLARFGYQFQLRIQWTGNCRLRQGIIYADLKEETPILNTQRVQPL